MASSGGCHACSPRKVKMRSFPEHSVFTSSILYSMTPGWHLWWNSFTVTSENLHTADIGSNTYLPRLFDVVCECLWAQCISDAVIKCCFRYEEKMRSMHLVQFWRWILNFLHCLGMYSHLHIKQEGWNKRVWRAEILIYYIRIKKESFTAEKKLSRGGQKLKNQ